MSGKQRPQAGRNERQQHVTPARQETAAGKPPESPGPDHGSWSKQDRAFDLAVSRYALRRAEKWPYVLLDDTRLRFQGHDLRLLKADLRTAWRERYPDEASPSDALLTAVFDDMRLRALEVPADAPAEQEDTETRFAADRGMSLVRRADGCPLPEDYQIPEPYFVKHDGIFGEHGRVSWAWLFPVAVYVDPGGDQWLELIWRDHGQWISRLVRRAISKSGRKLVMEIGDAGLPITDSEARDAERWLAAAEIVNARTISRRPVARQLGWQADGKTFVTSADTPWRVQTSYPDQESALAAHHPCGTLAGWQQAVKQTEPYLVAQAGVYAGLAPPLLEPLDLDSFTSDFSGRSTRGKTITAQLGLSCWADPSERSDGLFSWKTSLIGVEKRLNLVNGLPVVIDETRLVKDPALVDAVIYQIPKNHGQARGGGWPNRIPWRTIAISTGEQPAVSFTSHQGASARTLSVQTPPFGSDGADSRQVAESVLAGIEANYGTAGPAFVARLQRQLAEPDGLARLRDRHDRLTARFRGDNDMTGRRAPFVACLLLAAELAAEWNILPFPAPALEAWGSLFTAVGHPHDNRPEMALDIVREYIAANSARIWASGKPEPASGWIGRDMENGGIALIPEKLADELRKHGYALDAVLPGWCEMGVIELRVGQRPPYRIPQRIASRPVKCIVFTPDSADEHAEQFDDT